MRIALSGLLVSLCCMLLFTGCAQKEPPPVLVQIPKEKIDYLQDVKPILDKRCVICHSCYNSPCQLKLSSFEGLNRGASKQAIYNASRLRTMDPSRLFIDAETTEQWREKNFHGVTESSAEEGFNNSIMLQLLSHKMVNPESRGNYFPEAGDLTCADSRTELNSYLEKHPNNGMPFGFPPLKQNEYNIIAGWLYQGAQGPTDEEQKILNTIDPIDRTWVVKWEQFLNTQDPKHIMTARYLYEHLFLAHITFKTGSGHFYEIVRSTTPPGEKIEIIATIRPYDPPGSDQFYYRFRKIHSTIVHKTHMVFPMDEYQYNRFVELFITPEWLQEPEVVSYDAPFSANPFAVFEQIPPKSRYQFLLDNSNYIIMTFIRGPVCKGQVALNVIHDHFWVFFIDPEYDLTVKYPGFLQTQLDNLTMPTERESNYGIFSALRNRYSDGAIKYYQARQDLYSGYYYYDAFDIKTLWKGSKPEDAPALTIFRHFDSASVHRGVLGELPETAWVMDYPLLERIYYSLVAGFDVYGTAGHQLAVRLYMDRLRIEGESYFLNFMPREQRVPLMQQWYTGITLDDISFYPANAESSVQLTSNEPKQEFIEKFVQEYLQPYSGITFGSNYLYQGMDNPPLPTSYETTEDYLQAFSAVSAQGTPFFEYAQDDHFNLVHVRVRIPEKEDVVFSIVIHRWHDNVTFLFSEKNTLNPKKDRADFIEGFIGSYPNYYLEIEKEEMPDFFYYLANFNGSPEHIARLNSFGVNRADEGFWEYYDWFQERFNRDNPDTAGLFDLNRYYYLAK